MNLKFLNRFFKRIINRFKRKKIKAVFEDDLENLLISMGIQKDVNEGKYFCPICDCPITLENLGVITRKEGKIQLVCDNNKCLSQL